MFVIPCKRQLHFGVQSAALALFFLMAVGVQSQEADSDFISDESPAAIESLAPVHVQAQNPDNSLREVNLEHYTGFAKVLERSQFEGRFQSVPELLKTSSGVQLKQMAGLGSDSQLSLRGSKGKQVNIFLDGLLLNSPFDGSAQLQSIPTVLIESLEVYPDFTPLALSHANLSGAVNIKSRELESGETGADLMLASGSFATKALELSSWGALHGWQSILGVSYVSADNDYPVKEDTFRSTYTTRKNDAYQAEHAFLKVGKDYSGAKIQMLGQVHQHTKEVATIKNWESDAAFVDAESERIQLLADYDSGVWKFSHRLSYAAEENLFNDEEASIGLGREKVASHQESLGIFSIADVLLDEHQVMLSLDLREDEFMQQDEIKQEASLEGERKGATLGLSDDWKIKEQWLLHINTRFYFIDEDMMFLSENKTRVHDDFTARSWQIGNRYDLNDSLALKANVGRNIRLPYLFEKYGTNGTFEGNPDLSTEQADVVDAGLIFETTRYLASSNMFYKKIDDGIYQLFDSRGIGHPMNIGKSELIGLEVEWRFFAASWFTLESSATLMDSVNRSSIKSYQHQKMPGIYHQNLSISALFQWGRWSFNNRIDVYDDLYYDLANSVAAERQTQLTSSLMFVLTKFSFDISINNIMDNNYMDYNRMPSPGRSFMANAHLRF